MKQKVFAVLAVIFVLTVTVSLLAGCGEKKPEVTSISPPEGTAGTEVTIKGSGFGSDQGKGVVEFGQVTAEVSSWSDGEIKAKVPAGLEKGEYAISVATDAGKSSGMEFTVKEGGTATEPDENRKSGQVEHNTPAEAMIDYMKKNGWDPTGTTFSVYKVSAKDPEWKIDEASKAGAQPGFFLLHKVNGEWTVVAYGPDFNPQQYGAPSDLTWGGPPTPSPQPDMREQDQAVLNFLQSQGQRTNDWVLTLAKVSQTDPNWEVIKGTEISTQQTKYFLLVWNNANNTWEVLSDAGPPWTGVQFKGENVPSDLATL